MVDPYYVEFTNFDAAIKYQERYKFLINKYDRLREQLTKLKHDKLAELNNFLTKVRQLESELNEFNKFMPKERKAPPKTAEAEPAKKVITAVKPKRARKTSLPKKNLKELKKGLEQIKKELSEM